MNANPRKLSGYLIMIAGLIGLISRFIGDVDWSGSDIAKLFFSLLFIFYGIFKVFIMK